MTNTRTATPIKANERPQFSGPRPGGPMGHGPGGGSGEKAAAFGPSLKRLLGHLRPEITRIIAVIVMTIIATVANSVNPAILGMATNEIYDAMVVTKTAIDFNAVGQILLGALAVTLTYFLLSWLAGFLINTIVQRSVYRMRKQVSEKITRLPLKYFDGQPRGELLSRVTNDVDNISQTMQQTLSQILTNLFTLVGVLVMMFYVSPCWR